MLRKLVNLYFWTLLPLTLMAVEPFFTWDFNQPDFVPRLYKAELQDNALLCGYGKRNIATRLKCTASEFSLSLRFKPHEKSPDGTLIGYAFNSWGRNYFHVALEDNGTISVNFEMKACKKNYRLHSSKLHLIPGKYHTLQVASRSGGQCKIWLNNMLVAEGEKAMSFSDFKGEIPDAYPVFTIGHGYRNATSDNFFEGLIDDVKLFNVFLEPEKTVQIPPDANISKADPNVVMDGECIPSFIVPDRETEVLGQFVQAEKKFRDSASSAWLNLNEHELTVNIDSPIPSGLKAKTDGNIWNSDHIEFFFRPNPTEPVYFQYCVSFDGRMVASKYSLQRVAIPNFISEAYVQSQLTPTKCVITLRIPVKELGLKSVESGQFFTGNLIRSGRTSGGDTFWKNPGHNFHDLESFGILIAGSRRAYFERELKNILRGIKTDEETEQMIRAIRRQIASSGNRPEVWDTLHDNFSNLRMALLRSRLSGELLLIHKPLSLWENDFKPTPTTLPLLEISKRVPVNSRVYGCFVFTNLSNRHYMGRVRFSSPEKVDRKVKSLKAKSYLSSSRWRFYEALPMEDTSHRMIFDPLAPLTLNDIFRVEPRKHVPIYYEIDVSGMDAGTYEGVLTLKPSYSGFPEKKINIKLTIENINLKNINADNYASNYLLDSQSPTEYLEFYDTLNCSIIRISSVPGQKKLDIYPNVDKNGNILKIDFSDLDYVLDFYEKKGTLKNRKILLYLATNLYNYGLKKAGNPHFRLFSPPWVKGMQQWTRLLAKHLWQRYKLPAQNIILFPVDEPYGDINDPNSKLWHAMKVGKILKEANSGVRLMVNPMDKSKDFKNFKYVFSVASKYYDIFELYYPSLTKDKIRYLTSLNKELWSYYILGKSTSPLVYRSMGIKNFRVGFSGVSSFWHLDSHAGNDGLNSFDSYRYDKRNTYDYGVIYRNSNHIMVGRRLWAWLLGMDDYRLALFCQMHIKNNEHKSRLKKIISHVKSYDEIREQLLTFALELKRK